jgi:hypothetical protein
MKTRGPETWSHDMLGRVKQNIRQRLQRVYSSPDIRGNTINPVLLLAWKLSTYISGDTTCGSSFLVIAADTKCVGREIHVVLQGLALRHKKALFKSLQKLTPNR